MAEPEQPLHVVALHKLPFDEAAFARDVAGYGEHAKEWEPQLRENWSNAWLVVIESPGPPEYLKFDRFGTRDGQAAWLERILGHENGRTRAAFYLHYVNPSEPLLYGRTPLDLPPLAPAPNELLERMPYSSPD